MDELELRDFLRILRRHTWIVALTVIIGLASALAFWSQQTPTYRATAKIFVGPAVVDHRDVAQLHAQQWALTLMDSYAELARTRPLLERAVDGQGLPRTPQQVLASMSLHRIETTRILEITITDQDPIVAAQVANAVAETLAETVSGEIDTTGLAFASMLETATPPSSPINPGPARLAAIALGVGLTVGVCAAFLREYLRPRIDDHETAEQALGLPVLAAVSRGSREEQADASRLLRFQLSRLPEAPRIVLITSPGLAEGKSTVARSLAEAYARDGCRTLLLDANLRRPVLHDVYGLDLEPGVSEAIRDRSDPVAIARAAPSPRLAVLTAGDHGSTAPGDLLTTPATGRLLDRATASHEVVVIDGPPVLGVSDLAGLVPHADAIVLVVRARRTPTPAAQRAVELLTRAQAPLAGCVLTAVRGRRRPSPPRIPRPSPEAAESAQVWDSERLPMQT